MNEICVNIVTRSELKGHHNLVNLLQACRKERRSLKFDKYSFFEPIKKPLSEEAVSEIASSDNFCILLRDSKRAITGSIWMNNSIRLVSFESKKWTDQLSSDLWELTRDISQVIDIDFAFMDTLTQRVIQRGKEKGAVIKTNKNNNVYMYSLFSKSLS